MVIVTKKSTAADFTNYAEIKASRSPIRDYIFVTENIRVDAVAPLKRRDE